jgi:ABC-type nickel/cobalt efflux system permease component RcnA
MRAALRRIKEALMVPMPDAVSHVAHWIFVVVATFGMASVVGWIGGNEFLWAVWISTALLVGFGFWEGYNYATHRILDPKDMARWTRDGAWDFFGPLVNAILWWIVYLA